MGRPPRRAAREDRGVDGGRRRFLFDENVTSVGRGLRHIYDEVAVVEDVEDLGRGAADEQIIRWCVENQAVWVTKDWHRRRNPEQARRLYELKVSVAWFRPRGKRELTIQLLFAAAAAAMPRLISFYRTPGVRYAIIDDRGQVSEYALHRFVAGKD